MDLNILYQCDNNYAPYTGVSMTSLLRRNKECENIKVYILDDGIDENNRKKLITTADRYKREIEFIPASEIVQYIKECGMPKYRGGYTTYLKLFVGNYFKNEGVELERLLYIDSDTLILGNISGMTEIDMGNCILGMVCDSLTYKFKNKYIGADEEEPYFNAGMVLFDMKKWMQENATERVKGHLLTERSSYANHEQDIINVVFRHRIMRLDEKYNFQPVHALYTPEQYYKIFKQKNYYTKEELSESRKDIRIYHTYRFIGVFPWDENDVHPANSLFDKELKHSNWADYKKKKKELPLYMKVERLIFKYMPKMVFLRAFQLANHIVYTRANKKSYLCSINRKDTQNTL